MRLTKPCKLREPPRSCLRGRPRTEHPGATATALRRISSTQPRMRRSRRANPRHSPPHRDGPGANGPARGTLSKTPPSPPSPSADASKNMTRDPRGPGRRRKQGKLLEAELTAHTCPHVPSSTNRKRHQVDSAPRPMGLDGQQDASPRAGVSPAPAGARSAHARPQGRTEPTAPRQTQEAPPGVSPRGDTPRAGSSEAGKGLAGAGEGEPADGWGLPAGDGTQSGFSAACAALPSASTRGSRTGEAVASTNQSSATRRLWDRGQLWQRCTRSRDGTRPYGPQSPGWPGASRISETRPPAPKGQTSRRPPGPSRWGSGLALLRPPLAAGQPARAHSGTLPDTGRGEGHMPTWDKNKSQQSSEL